MFLLKSFFDSTTVLLAIMIIFSSCIKFNFAAAESHKFTFINHCNTTYFGEVTLIDINTNTTLSGSAANHTSDGPFQGIFFLQNSNCTSYDCPNRTLVLLDVNNNLPEESIAVVEMPLYPGPEDIPSLKLQFTIDVIDPSQVLQFNSACGQFAFACMQGKNCSSIDYNSSVTTGVYNSPDQAPAFECQQVQNLGFQLTTCAT